MTRSHSILLALVVAAAALPVQAARPQSARRGSGVSAPRHVAPERRSTGLPSRPGQGLTRGPAAASPAQIAVSRRPEHTTARRNGSSVSPLRGSGLLPVDAELTEVPMAGPGNSRTRPISIDRPGLDAPYRPAPEMIDLSDGIGNGGGGNGGGGNGGGGNGGGGNGGGGNGGGGNGGGRHPHPGRRPCHGPTGWDILAIGLATAAFADGGLAVGGCSASDCVTVGQPACSAGTTIVEAQPVVVETASSEFVVAAVAAPAEAETLPQLRVGERFQLPAKGLGAEQGRVGVKIGAAILDCPVTAWNDAGLAATVPAMTLAGSVKAELIVALADGGLAAVMPVELLPAAAAD